MIYGQFPMGMPGLAQMMMMYNQGFRPQSFGPQGQYGASAQIPMLASMMGGGFLPGRGVNLYGRTGVNPAIPASFYSNPHLMGGLGNSFNPNSWTRPGGGGVLGNVGGKK